MLSLGMLDSSYMVVRHEDALTDVSGEIQDRFIELSADEAVFFQYRLDVTIAISSLDVVLAVNDRVVEIADPEQEVLRRVLDIEEKRTLLLACMRVDENGMETELLAVPVPMNDRARAMLRAQVEADVQREMTWAALGSDGQDAAVADFLGASDDPNEDAEGVVDF